MGVESVSVAEAVSRAGTLKISCHSPTRVLLPALESTGGKNIEAIDAIQRTFAYKITEVQHLHYIQGKAARTQIILSPETP